MSASDDAVWGLQLFENDAEEERLAAISADGYVRVWDTEKRECVKSWDYEGVEAKEGSFKRKRIVPTAIALVKSSAKDKPQLAVAYFDSVVKIFDATTGEEKLKIKSDESYGESPLCLPSARSSGSSPVLLQMARLRPRSIRSLLILQSLSLLPHTRTNSSASSASRLVRCPPLSPFLRSDPCPFPHCRRMPPLYPCPSRRRHLPLLPLIR